MAEQKRLVAAREYEAIPFFLLVVSVLGATDRCHQVIRSAETLESHV